MEEMTYEELAELTGLTIDELLEMEDEIDNLEEWEDFEEVGQEAPCDLSGLCAGMSCPYFWKCQGA